MAVKPPGVDIEPLDEGAVARMLPRSTEEIIADAVASNPAHSTPLSARLRRAGLEARAANKGNTDEIYQEFYDARIREVGGDPDAMLPGNKPRYTCDDDGNVKDHETGVVHSPTDGGISEVLQAPQVEGDPAQDDAGTDSNDAAAANPTEGNPQATDSPASASGRTPVDQCEHAWPEPVEAETPCSVCGLTFGAWAQQ